jgi:hypothetical protein
MKTTKTVQKARRAAAQLGFRVEKARGGIHINNLGELQLVNERNVVILGGNYDATPEEVVEFCQKQGGR